MCDQNERSMVRWPPAGGQSLGWTHGLPGEDRNCHMTLTGGACNVDTVASLSYACRLTLKGLTKAL